MELIRVKNTPAYIQSINFFFYKGAKAIQWEQKKFSTNEILCAVTIRKNETLTPYLIAQQN